MAKFVFLSVPAFGHFNPTLPVIAELVRRGHEVVVFNCADFEPAIAALGAEFREYPGGFSSRKLSEILHKGSLPRAFIFAREAAAFLVPWLIEEIPALEPDCVVYDAQAVHGHIATRMLDLRSVSIFPYPVIEPTNVPLGLRTTLRFVGQNGPYLLELARSRAMLSKRFGADTLPSTRPHFQSRGDLTLLLTSPVLQRRDAYRDDTMVYVGPCIEEQVHAIDFPFERLDGRPVVYVSLGTLATDNIDFFRACQKAFADLPVQVVMSIGQLHDADALGRVPDNFIVRPHVPQLEVLKIASAFVTQAGFTSFQEALYYGVPLVALPQQIEQLMNARLAESCGAGISLEQHYLGKSVASDQLRHSVQRVLEDASFREAARKLSAELRRSGGYRRAADELEVFVGIPAGIAPADAHRHDPASAAQ